MAQYVRRVLGLEDASRQSVINDTRTRGEAALVTLRAVVFAGVLLLALHGLRSGINNRTLTLVVVPIIIGAAALMIGGILGFLFGVPRTLQGESAADRDKPEYRANTNLEQISDWLTKILVGVTLTQLTEIPRTLEGLGSYIAARSGLAITSPAFAVGLLLFFVVCGFLYGYLWARLNLIGAFREADLETLSERIIDQDRDDAEAIRLARNQLEQQRDTPPPTQESLTAAFANASDSALLVIFEEARKVRKRNWERDKEEMENCIPVFRALIAAKPDRHGYCGQLGFALKDRRTPDYPAAEEMLTRAIELRDETGYLYYEINRAICRIMLDPDFKNGQPSTVERREAILGDLRKSAAELAFIDPPIAEIDRWLAINNLKLEDLRPSSGT